MLKVTREYFCDLCGNSDAKTYRTLAEFQTEQNEGRIVTPYVTTTDIDLCKECLKKVVVLGASGAQGVNSFWLKKKES